MNRGFGPLESSSPRPLNSVIRHYLRRLRCRCSFYCPSSHKTVYWCPVLSLSSPLASLLLSVRPISVDAALLRFHDLLIFNLVLVSSLSSRSYFLVCFSSNHLLMDVYSTSLAGSLGPTSHLRRQCLAISCHPCAHSVFPAPSCFMLSHALRPSARAVLLHCYDPFAHAPRVAACLATPPQWTLTSRRSRRFLDSTNSRISLNVYNHETPRSE